MAQDGSAAEKMKNEVNFTRVFDAPRELVFEVWTDPKHLALWWGPDGYTNPLCELDVRPGGAIRIDMRAPDGIVYPMTGVYQEVVRPERLSFLLKVAIQSSALDKEGQPLFELLTIATFAEHGGKTTLTLRAHVLKSTPAAASYLAGMEEGWKQMLDRLGDSVAKA
jgi:uncharacterized protein YndB with AHSA1/START domain